MIQARVQAEPPPPGRTSRREAWIVAALLMLFAGFAAVSLWGDSATFDETFHIPAGYTYLDRFDFRLNPEHPPLVKMWAAVPLLALDLLEPPYRSSSWGGLPGPDGATRTGANQWIFGFEAMNGPVGARERRDPRPVLRAARMMMLAPGVLLGWLVYRFSRRLFGTGGGLLSLALYCLSPTMLAHTRLVTTDLPVALGYLGSVFALHGFTRRPGPVRALGVGAVLGGALLAKFSAVLLVPILALLSGAWWGGRYRTDNGQRPANGRVWVHAALAAAAAWTVLWAGYGFRWSASADAGYRLRWEQIEEPTAAAATAARWLGASRVVPEAYSFGLDFAVGGAERRLAFLNGETSYHGWWYYFPETFALKTPPATLAILAWALVLAVRRSRAPSLDAWFVLVPVVLYGAVSIASSLNLGHRHLVPVYPFLFVGAGAVAGAWSRAWPRRVLAFLLCGSLVSWALATPRYLSYFNLTAGGETGGWRYLVDSNIDWGQDLSRLPGWLERNGVSEIHLAYFGTADPRAYRIPYRKVLLAHDFRPDEPAGRPGAGDWFATSVTLLQGLYVDDDHELSVEALQRGWIAPDAVREWLQLRDAAVLQGGEFAGFGAWLVRTGRLGPGQLEQLERRLLGTWIRRVRDRLTPEGRVGGSILVYRIPEDDGWLE